MKEKKDMPSPPPPPVNPIHKGNCTERAELTEEGALQPGSLTMKSAGIGKTKSSYIKSL